MSGDTNKDEGDLRNDNDGATKGLCAESSSMVPQVTSGNTIPDVRYLDREAKATRRFQASREL